MLWPYDIPLNPHLLAGDPYVMVYYKSPRSWVELYAPTKTLIHWPVAWGSKKSTLITNLRCEDLLMETVLGKNDIQTSSYQFWW